MTNRERELNGDMENIIPPAETTGKSPKVYKDVIKEDRLPLYEEAAKRSGYGVNVTARAGEDILVSNKERGTSHTVKVSPGFVQVGVTVPLGQETVGTTPFYKALTELEQSPK